MPTTASKRFGPFEVLTELGRGGNATVYKVRHKPTGKVAALKVPSALLTLDNALLRRFRQEFTAVHPLRHPSLVRVLAQGEQDELPYLVLEYVAGRNLEDHLREKGPLPPEEALAVFRRVAEGVRYLHGEGLVHRDIKPGNIFLTANGHAKLGDFGLLKRLEQADGVTRSGQGLGTIDYGAPEQFENARHVDRRCDLYSLGASLYAALTGKFPFGNGGRLQILQRKLFNEFVPLRLLMPQLDPALDDLVCRCLRAEADERLGGADEFLDALRRAKPAASEPPSEHGPSPRKRATGIDRRASVRFAVDLTTTFVPFHQNLRGRWEATILDVSPLGLRLQTPRPVALQSVLELRLPGMPRSALALVRWVRSGRDETQVAGCSFVQPLSQEAIEKLQGKPR